MEDRLISADFENGKAIVMRTYTNDDGTTYEKEIEIDLPKIPTTEGILKRVKRGEDGKMYETEEVVEFPIPFKPTE